MSSPGGYHFETKPGPTQQLEVSSAGMPQVKKTNRVVKQPRHQQTDCLKSA